MDIRKINRKEEILGPLNPLEANMHEKQKKDVSPKYFYTAPYSLAMAIRKKTLS